MGCKSILSNQKFVFLDGGVGPFIRFPLTRWQRLTEWHALLVPSPHSPLGGIVMAEGRSLASARCRVGPRGLLSEAGRAALPGSCGESQISVSRIGADFGPGGGARP